MNILLYCRSEFIQKADLLFHLQNKIKTLILILMILTVNLWFKGVI